MSLEKLADLIFPNIDKTPEYYLEKYPKRNLKRRCNSFKICTITYKFQHIGGVLLL